MNAHDPRHGPRSLPGRLIVGGVRAAYGRNAYAGGVGCTSGGDKTMEHPFTYPKVTEALDRHMAWGPWSCRRRRRGPRNLGLSARQARLAASRLLLGLAQWTRRPLLNSAVC
jgi:hypothetical protein